MTEISDRPSALDFQGKVAVITGAASGIANAAARQFAARGARVALIDVSAEVEAAAGKIERSGAKALGIRCDLGSAAQINGAVDRIIGAYGRIDALANVAGIFPYSPFLDMDEALLDRLLDVNVKGVVRMCQAVLPHMIAQQEGAIVNVSSGAARKPLPNLSGYGASKAAVEALTRMLAMEFAPAVRVNAVAPGATGTATVLASIAARAADPAPPPKSTAAQQILLGRMAEPEEVANAIVYLCSAQASFITGQILGVNGGSLM